VGSQKWWRAQLGKCDLGTSQEMIKRIKEDCIHPLGIDVAAKGNGGSLVEWVAQKKKEHPSKIILCQVRCSPGIPLVILGFSAATDAQEEVDAYAWPFSTRGEVSGLAARVVSTRLATHP
jgi:hypothetical protein